MIETTEGQIVEFGSHLIPRAEWVDAPVAISWLPQTLAWKLIACALLLTLISYGLTLWYRHLKTTYLREAWQRFMVFDANNDIAEIAQLTKQLAHQHWPAHQVGTMDPTSFARFLSHSTPSTLKENHIIELMTSSYQASPTVSEPVRASIRHWFKEVTC
ncbi:DUF4381 domain-containing protein [Vibrio sp. FNV 38]|nr:DUF4381 domain-containing protein [Vibrio sp. FNV 38]